MARPCPPGRPEPHTPSAAEALRRERDRRVRPSRLPGSFDPGFVPVNALERGATRWRGQAQTQGGTPSRGHPRQVWRVSPKHSTGEGRFPSRQGDSGAYSGPYGGPLYRPSVGHRHRASCLTSRSRHSASGYPLILACRAAHSRADDAYRGLAPVPARIPRQQAPECSKHAGTSHSQLGTKTISRQSRRPKRAPAGTFLLGILASEPNG